MATRSPTRSTSVRHIPPQPVRRKRRFRRLRRLLVLLAVLILVAVGARAYVLQVYAPGLRAEARTIPARVHLQLAAHDAPYVTLGEITPDLPHAVVAVEDRRFYYHPGVDPIGVVRAAWINWRAQHVDQGGSTLEEQLVKRTIVPDDRSLHAKLRIAAIAWAVDQVLPKPQVLELYLNAAYYGQGAYGADSAARVYFGTDPAHLTLSQAAYLAALPQAPSIYGAHPTSQAIVARQHVVLQDMENSQYITAAQARAAEQAPLRFALPNP